MSIVSAASCPVMRAVSSLPESTGCRPGLQRMIPDAPFEETRARRVRPRVSWTGLAGLLAGEALEDALRGLEPAEIAEAGGLLTQLAGRVIEAAHRARAEVRDGSRSDGRIVEDALCVPRLNLVYGWRGGRTWSALVVLSERWQRWLWPSCT